MEITPPYNPQPNSAAERMGGHINEAQRIIGTDSELRDNNKPLSD
jgi:hypothetical protein